jgi:hypothetical protein
VREALEGNGSVIRELRADEWERCVKRFGREHGAS